MNVFVVVVVTAEEGPRSSPRSACRSTGQITSDSRRYGSCDCGNGCGCVGGNCRVGLSKASLLLYRKDYLRLVNMVVVVVVTLVVEVTADFSRWASRCRRRPTRCSAARESVPDDDQWLVDTMVFVVLMVLVVWHPPFWLE